MPSALTKASNNSLPAVVERLMVEIDTLAPELSPLAIASTLRFWAYTTPVNSRAANSTLFIQMSSVFQEKGGANDKPHLSGLATSANSDTEGQKSCPFLSGLERRLLPRHIARATT